MNDELNEKELEGIIGGYPGSVEVREELARKQAEYINSLRDNGELTEEQLAQINNMTLEELEDILNNGTKRR